MNAQSHAIIAIFLFATSACSAIETVPCDVDTACEAGAICHPTQHECVVDPVACVADLECASNVCLPRGTCAAPSSVQYLSPGATGTTCTFDAPCGHLISVREALPTRPIIVAAPGQYSESAYLQVTTPMTLLARGSRFETANMPVLSIDGTQVVVHDAILASHNSPVLSCQGGAASLATLELHGTRVANATQELNELGIMADACDVSLTDATLSGHVSSIDATKSNVRIERSAIKNGGGIHATDSSITLMDSTIQDGLGWLLWGARVQANLVRAVFNGGDSGLVIEDGNVVVHQSELQNLGFYGLYVSAATELNITDSVIRNTMIGVYASQSQVTIQRSKILRNAVCGIRTEGGTYHIDNNIVARNGGESNGEAANVVLAFPDAASVFAYNTVAAPASMASQTGVRCFGQAYLVGNIIEGASSTNLGGSNACPKTNYAYNMIKGNSGGNMNVDVWPEYVAPENDDFRTRRYSPIIDRGGDACANYALDIEGEVRGGDPCDIGADETSFEQ